jgi:predicted RNA-binding Zn-ribbon protein involved in translation (DUF1610 family)
MTHEPTEIYRADSLQQATLLKGLLEDDGIEARVESDMQSMAGGEVPLGWPSLARVVVPEEQAAKARQLVLQFEQQMRERRQRDATATGVLVDEEEDVWRQWPVCPDCGQKRQVRCHICGTAGTDFPLVDIDRSGGREQVLLFCRTCDDHFRPQFYRRCHTCGYDYGNGIRSGEETPLTPEERITPRVWLVLAGMVAAGAVVAGYFAWLLR